MKGWTDADINHLRNKGMVKENRPTSAPASKVKEKKKKVRIPQPESEGLRFIKQYLQLLKIEFVTEYKFYEKRKFRFDVYFEISGKRIGVEYDGIFSKKSRHTSITGFSMDTEKTNLAAKNGFLVLRYTAMNYKNIITDIEHLIK